MEKKQTNKSTSVYGNLTFGIGIIAIILALWAGFIVMALGPENAIVLLHAKDYRKAEFVVEKLFFIQGSRSPGAVSRSSNKYWAEGKVEGNSEKFTLGSYLIEMPNSQEQLESQVSVGQILPVLYNPNVDVKTEARVFFPKDNFLKFWQQRWKNIFLTAYLPLGVALIICITSSFLAKSWSGLNFTITSLVISLSGWIFVFLKFG